MLKIQLKIHCVGEINVIVNYLFTVDKKKFSLALDKKNEKSYNCIKA